MTKDEALKLALEALEKSHTCPLLPDDCAEAITAIKEALAQLEQEPVTWRYKIVDVFGRPAWTLKTPKSDTRVLESQPLYTTPPQPWEKFCDSNCVWTDHHPDCKLAEQESVTWRNAAIRVGEDLCSVGPFGYYDMTAEQWLDWALSVVTVHAPPPQRKPLTAEEIDDVYSKANCDYISIQDSYLFARAIEAAHGIKGKA